MVVNLDDFTVIDIALGVSHLNLQMLVATSRHIGVSDLERSVLSRRCTLNKAHLSNYLWRERRLSIISVSGTSLPRNRTSK